MNAKTEAIMITYRWLHIVAKFVETANAILVIASGGGMQLAQQVFDFYRAPIGIVVVTHVELVDRNDCNIICNI